MPRNLFFYCVRCTIMPFLLALSTLAFSQQYKGDSWSKVKSVGSGTLAIVYNEQFGLIFKGSDGKVSGVCVDIISDFQQYIATKYGKRISVEYLGEEKDFPRFLSIVQNTPNVLGVTNTTITEDRKKILKFTPAYMTTQQVLLTHKNAPAIKNLSQLPAMLSGYNAHILMGSTHVQHIQDIKKEHFPALKIAYVPSTEAILKNMSANPKIFTILDFTDYIGIVKRRLPLKRQDVQLEDTEKIGFIMSRQSDWDEVWNEFLTTEYRQSVRYKEIITKNLGAPFVSLVR